MSTEREAKLVATDDVVLPSFAGVVDGVLAGDPQRRTLTAVYFDTDDLTLARAGLTLRHREGDTGDSGERWTLKLADSANGSELTRREVTFTGPPQQVPRGAADLVRVHTRGRPLAPVVRLRTVRTTVELTRSDGAPVAEVADDRVTASVGTRTVAKFREVEVELLDGAAEDGDAILDAAIDRLRAAGASAGPAMAKLVRALGPPAASPPDLVVGEVDRSTDAREFLRQLIACSTARMLAHDPLLRLGAEPEDIHAFRVATRRLRSDLRTFAQLLDEDWARGLRAELKWIADVVGAVRDVDVMEMRLRDHASDLGAGDATAARQLLSSLAGERAAAQDTLGVALRSDRYDELIASIVAASAHPSFTGAADVDVPARPVVAAQVRRADRKLLREVRRAGKHPSDEALHQIRIVAKRARYASEAAARVWGKRADRLAAAISDVQTVLGDHHDTAVAEEWLRRAVGRSGGGSGVAAGMLIARQQHERERLAGEWKRVWKRASKPKLRNWL